LWGGHVAYRGWFFVYLFGCIRWSFGVVWGFMLGVFVDCAGAGGAVADADCADGGKYFVDSGKYVGAVGLACLG
jgi:hypothetical protein